MNLIQYISQANPEDKIVSKKNSPWNNAKNWYNEYGKVNKLADNKVTDENKHQYMSRRERRKTGGNRRLDSRFAKRSL